MRFLLLFLSHLLLWSCVISKLDWVASRHLDTWLSDMDRCILANKTQSSTDLIHTQCEQSLIKENIPVPPERCRLGNSWPSKSGHCSAEDLSYSERLPFLQALDGYDDPTSLPLKELFGELSKKKGSVLLIGDSVMQQFYSALACELEREQVWTDPRKFTNTDEVQYVHNVPIKFVPIYHFVNGKWDRVPNAAMHHLTKAVDSFAALHDYVLIIMNVGLHYVSTPIAQFSKQDYNEQITMALTYLNDYATKIKDSKKIKVIWRETSAQHFPTPNGYWPGVRYAAGMKLACVPINDTSTDADWRNNYVKDIIASNSLDHVRIIPYYDVTIPLWSLHVNGHMRDCTHFCYTPMLYQYLFHKLLDEVKNH